jgi:F-type H+-transporting ATPase subunit b
MTWFVTPAYAQETTAPAADPAHAAEPAAADAHGAAPAEGAAHTEVAHEGGHEGVFPPFDSSTFASQLLWLAITFGLLYWMVSKIVAPRIGAILEVRRDRIGADLAEAERMRGETQAAIAAYEQSLAEAKARAGAIATETREKVAKELDARRHAAEAELAGRLAAAEAEISAIKASAMGEVDAIATETTEAIVSALIGRGTREEAAAAVADTRKA